MGMGRERQDKTLKAVHWACGAKRRRDLWGLDLPPYAPHASRVLYTPPPQWGLGCESSTSTCRAAVAAGRAVPWIGSTQDHPHARATVASTLLTEGSDTIPLNEANRPASGVVSPGGCKGHGMTFGGGVRCLVFFFFGGGGGGSPMTKQGRGAVVSRLAKCRSGGMKWGPNGRLLPVLRQTGIALGIVIGGVQPLTLPRVPRGGGGLDRARQEARLRLPQVALARRQAGTRHSSFPHKQKGKG